MAASTISAIAGEDSSLRDSRTALRLPGGRDGRDPDRAIKRGPSRLPREAVLATQRDRLYDGLVRTVAAHGYANATVTEICRAAGVTRPAFYEHFDLLLDALDTSFAEMAGDAEWREAVWRVLEILLDVLAGTPAFAAAAIVEIEMVGPEARRKKGELLQRFRAFFAGAPALPAHVDRTTLLDTAIGGVYAALYQRVSSGRVAQLPELLPVLGYFVLAPFGLAGAPVPASDAAERPRVVLPCMPLFLTPEQS
jgi:AcrR family transcriptional regulator